MSLFSRRKPRPGPVEADCAEHGPCQPLLALEPAEAGAMLRPLITTPGPQLGPDPVVRRLGDELVIVLCAKAPADPADPDGAADALVVPQHIVDVWNMPSANLWDRAFANLRGEPADRKSFGTTAGPDLHVVNGRGWPGAVQVFRLEEATGEDLPYGALVAMPTRNVVCSLAVHSARIVDMVPHMIKLAQQLRAADAAPMGTRVYWYHEGVLEDLNARLHGENDARMRISQRFKDLLEQLPQI